MQKVGVVKYIKVWKKLKIKKKCKREREREKIAF
jgi:hypothetical protein